MGEDYTWLFGADDRGRTPRHVFHLVERLLRRCAAEPYKSNLDARLRGATEDRASLSEFIAHVDTAMDRIGWAVERPNLDEKHLSLVFGMMASYPELDEDVRARGVALSLDRRFGRHFFAQFLFEKGGQVWDAKEGDAVPVPYVDRVHRTRRRRIDPSRLEDPVDRLPWLRVVPPLKGWSLKLDTRFAAPLACAGSDQKPHDSRRISIGVACVNRYSGKDEELTWEVSEYGTKRKFTYVRPIDREDQLDRMRRLMEIARETVDILVYPELVTTSSGQAALLRDFAMAGRGKRLVAVVAGSSHCLWEEAETRVNRAAARFAGVEWILTHDKLATYSYFAPDGLGGTVEHVEDIQCKREITVCLSRNWYMAILICKDAFDSTNVVPLLRGVGANLILVPSHTDRVDEMVPPLQDLANKNQGLAVIANNPLALLNDPARLRDQHAALIAPNRVVEPCQIDPELHPPPRLVVFNLEDGFWPQLRVLPEGAS